MVRKCKHTNYFHDGSNKKRATIFRSLLFAEDSVFCQSLDQSGLLSCCCNRDALAIAKPAADRLKFDDPVGQGKQGVILAATNIDARHNGGATLADQNGTSRYAFTAVGLHAEAFGIGVASVAG